MTKKRVLHCQNPNCPHEKLLSFSDWIREELPDSSTNFLVTDIDWMMWLKNDTQKKVMLLETKTKNNNVPEYQKEMLRFVHYCFKNGVPGDWIYLGLHVLIFENFGPKDGRIYFDRKEITAETLRKVLSFQIKVDEMQEVERLSIHDPGIKAAFDNALQPSKGMV